MKEINLVIVGNLAYDTIKTKSIENKVYGGGAYYVASGASVFSKKVGLVSKFGKDHFKNELEKLEICLDGVDLLKDKKTDRFFVENYEDNNQNIIEEISAGMEIKPMDIPSHYLEAKRIHLSTMDPRKQIEIIKWLKKRSNALISFNTCLEYIKENKKLINQIIEKTDLAFLNKSEYDQLDKKPKNFVVTTGKDGAIAIINGELHYNFPKKALVKSTVGCGDVLTGSFLALISENKDFQTALRSAVSIATITSSIFGVENLANLWRKNGLK